MQDRFRSIFFLLVLSGLFSACSSSFLSRGSSGSSYQEDLSKVRPRYDFNESDIAVAEPEKAKTGGATAAASTGSDNTATVEKELNTILQTLNQQNKSVKYMPGFRIQLYVGNTRSEADGAKAFVYRTFPEMTPYVTFSQPTYRVKAGDFMSKSEAEQILATVRLQYTTAMIIADKIEIEKALQQAIAGK